MNDHRARNSLRLEHVERDGTQEDSADAGTTVAAHHDDLGTEADRLIRDLQGDARIVDDVYLGPDASRERIGRHESKQVTPRQTLDVLRGLRALCKRTRTGIGGRMPGRDRLADVEQVDDRVRPCEQVRDVDGAITDGRKVGQTEDGRVGGAQIVPVGPARQRRANEKATVATFPASEGADGFAPCGYSYADARSSDVGRGRTGARVPFARVSWSAEDPRMPANLLFVEDDPLIRRALAAHLRRRGHRVREADSVAAATKLLPTEPFDAVLLDYTLPDGTGFDVMAAIELHQPGVPALMLTAHGSVEHAVEAMKRGAFTYVQKPVEVEAIEVHIAQAIETLDLRRENRRLRRLGAPGPGADAILGGSDVAASLRDQVRRIAASPARAVLLEGESGTGKGLVARAVHEESARAEKPFVAITCSAMPDQLLESELFGHESGAFTDAKRRKMGLVEAAEGGTLFLDEIGDMAAPLQAKLLGVLEERRFRRLGGIQEIDVDLRVISATHRELRALVRDGKFREDLLYRLRVVPIRIPPLRERAADIPVLAAHFVTQLAAGWGRSAIRISDAALVALSVRPWPGNVRELRNAIERAVILARSTELMPADFREDWVPAGSPAGAEFAALPVQGLKVEEWIDDLVRQSLARAQGNQSAAARLLGMSRDQIRYRMQRIGLLKEGKEPKGAESE